MHLVRIEVENFKSFGGESIIPFEEGFTAITGPNGSGKSNCGDAIGFVLGPKSTRSLRASNVSELIFNGGKSGSPAKHMSATLVFSNTPEVGGKRRLRSDSDEVSFTRSVKLNRKGNPVSSFRINDNPSSATEMRRILSEAGLRGDGYNIVLQGDVTNLATMTPHKRRGVLEQVAGVTAYDDEIRKANTQRKHVENSIETIDIFEADQKGRLTELEKEREQALKFRELKGEADLARLTLEQSKHRNRQGEVSLLSEERSNYVTKEKDLSKEMLESSQRLDGYDKELVQLRRDLEVAMGEDAKEIIDKIRQHEIDLETASDRIGDHKRAIESSEEEIEILIREREGADKARIQSEQSITDLHQRVSDSKAALKKAAEDEEEARKAIQSGDKLGRDLNRLLGKATEDEQSASTAYSQAQLDYDRANQRSQIASENLVDIEQAFETAELERDDHALVGEDLEDSSPDINRESMAKELMSLQKQERSLVDDRDRAESKLRNAEMGLAKAKARMEARSSTPGSAHTLAALSRLRESGEIHGILGTLGELASPKDPSHEEALSFAFGGGLRSIVVTSDHVASKCITWLRKNGGGRATFLPLNKLSVSRPQGRTLLVARNPGVVGFVHDLLEFDQSVETAVRYAGRNTLVVDSMDVARENMGGVRMVTLDGAVIESSGAMTGGSSSKKGRPRFEGSGAGSSGIDRMEMGVQEADLLFFTVDGALRELRRSQQELRDRIHGLDNDDHSVRIRNWKADMSRAEKAVSEIRTKLKAANKELDECESEKSRLSAICENARVSLEEATATRSKAAEDLQNHTPDYLSVKLREAERVRTEAERTRVMSEASIETSTQQLKILIDRVAELDRQVKSQNDSISRAEKEIGELKSSIGESESMLLELREQASQFDEEQKLLNDKRDEIIEERASLRAHLERISQEKQSISGRLEELSVQIKQRREALDEIVAELGAAGIPIPPEDAQLPTVVEAERSVQGLERRLRALGDVNMLAIEQYDAAAARITDLIADGNLLRKRRDELSTIADQLEDERKTRLLNVFEHVNNNFRRVYEILQPTGSGELKLENIDSPFDGGLEMACVPPGKSQNTRRAALSGGEKSMAALALIFAIQDYEPSPFYYFDEVDQNLDPFNSEKIAALCRMRSGMAQFIMVTLRKVSLTLADHHIGITHAGNGCSQRITDFDRAAALDLSEEIEAEEKARIASETEKEAMPELPSPADMPKTPEPLPAPSSLGGLADRAGVDVPEDGIPEPEGEGLQSLRGRTEDVTEDIEESETAQTEEQEEAPSIPEIEYREDA
ncbi:MAG TPA: chromosome segregation protein SMC [Candidatus Poseidoniales archaeon]|jgi:chromosome segregation protein|nr:MAG: chromosome segregation protein SMC [Euryarchaeota archaeon]HIG34155.1 chromosome segregation protein SMC [Candidatus Poseidoniales archaeon]HIL67880.1 chromosome segregation protein SMC [Candidatus Poseidoniales archaeon]